MEVCRHRHRATGSVVFFFSFFIVDARVPRDGRQTTRRRFDYMETQYPSTRERGETCPAGVFGKEAEEKNHRAKRLCSPRRCHRKRPASPVLQIILQ